MKWLRKTLGGLALLVGVLSSYALYALSEERSRLLLDPWLLAAMVIACGISFLNFFVSRFFSTVAMRPAIGIAGSYMSFLALVLLIACINGQKAKNETIMWLPVLVFFGILYMAPLVGMTWLGTTLLFEAPSRAKSDVSDGTKVARSIGLGR